MKDKSETVEGKVASYLAEHPNAKPKEIAAALTLNAGSVAGALSKLKKKDGHVPAKRAPRTAKSDDPIVGLKAKAEKLSKEIADLESRENRLEAARAEFERINGAIELLSPKAASDEASGSDTTPTNGQATHVQVSEEASLS